MITACFCCLFSLNRFLSRASHWDSSSDNKNPAATLLQSRLTSFFCWPRVFCFWPGLHCFSPCFFLETLFLKDFPNELESGAVSREYCPPKPFFFFFFSRRPSSAHNIANNCLYSVSLSSHSLRVSVCLMSWFGCPLKRSFQSGYFGPHFDSLAVCLHPVVHHPLQELPLCVCVSVRVRYSFFCAHVFLHSTINCLCYTLYIVSIWKIGLFSLETEVNHKEEPLAASQRNNQPPVSWCFSAPLITLKRTVYCRQLLSILMERRGA